MDFSSIQTDNKHYLTISQKYPKKRRDPLEKKISKYR